MSSLLHRLGAEVTAEFREFLRRLKYAFDSAGIEIPLPQVTVYAANSRGSSMRNINAGS